MSDSFTFKRFAVRQERCAMKVGTDGVLLGAWAEGGSRILDIGTGTGLIALMMAQRFSEAHLTAIDIDEDACVQARENVFASPFRDRIEVVHTSLQDELNLIKAPSHFPQHPFVFDAIVGNPPFFENSLKNPDKKRSLARHTETLSFQELLRGAAAMLSAEGVFSVVIPTERMESFMTESYFQGLFLSRKCLVKTVERRQPKRCLLAFRKQRPTQVEETTACLQQDGERSEWYRKLTGDFYLS